MNVTQWLLHVDRILFFLINKELSFSSLNNIMLLIRQPFTWIPLYFFFLLFFYFNCRSVLLPIVVLTLFTFALSDFASASVLKPLIGRLRPCHDPLLQSFINNIASCGGLFSMPSSHASNHFGLAVFWYLIIKKTLNIKWYWLWFWAFAVCYSQIYVGVHYPADIITGALLGTGIAHFTYYLFLRWIANVKSIINTAP